MGETNRLSKAYKGRQLQARKARVKVDLWCEILGDRDRVYVRGGFRRRECNSDEKRGGENLHDTPTLRLIRLRTVSDSEKFLRPARPTD